MSEMNLNTTCTSIWRDREQDKTRRDGHTIWALSMCVCVQAEKQEKHTSAWSHNYCLFVVVSFFFLFSFTWSDGDEWDSHKKTQMSKVHLHSLSPGVQIKIEPSPLLGSSGSDWSCASSEQWASAGLFQASQIIPEKLWYHSQKAMTAAAGAAEEQQRSRVMVRSSSSSSSTAPEKPNN